MKRNRLPSEANNNNQQEEGNQPRQKQQKTQPTGNNNNAQPPQLRVQDALMYLDQVKRTFSDKPFIYSKFLEIMKEFKNHVIDTPGVIQKVSELFKGHKELILGFNSFLPPGYKIEFHEEDQTGRVSMPGTSQQPPSSSVITNNTTPQKKKRAQTPPVNTATPNTSQISATTEGTTTTEKGPNNIDFQQAISYVTKIKHRFLYQPTTYKAFLDILHNYQREQTTIKKVYEQVSELFADHPDLLNEFKQFLPMPAIEQQKGGRKTRERSKKQPVQSAPQPVVEEKKKRPTRSATSKPKQYEDFEYEGKHQLTSYTDTHKKTCFVELPGTPSFFVELREKIGECEYKQILKCINLYTSDIIDRSELLDMISESEPLRKYPDMFKKLKKLISTNTIDESAVSRKESISRSSSSKLYGPSYRVLPKVEVVCSERTELCNQVLNDELVSVPAGSEESSGTHKKTQYDEIIYQCEDDRCELDIVIEQNLSTLKFLNVYINQLKNNEQLTFNFEDLRDIHRASISRIYAEKGIEVLEGLRRNPSVSIPIIFKRLSQKGEEWKKARKELNRFWHDIYERNYEKAMESQASSFKQIEKKKMAVKNILKDMKSRHEYNRPVIFDFPDKQIHGDIYYLLMNLTEELSEEQVRDINQIWKSFIIPFFELSTLDITDSSQYDNLIREKNTRNEVMSSIYKFSDMFEKKLDQSDLYLPLVEQPICNIGVSRITQFYSNSVLLLVFRFYQSIYDKLLKAKELSKKVIRFKKFKLDSSASKVAYYHTVLLEQDGMSTEKKEKEKDKLVDDIRGVDESMTADQIYSLFISLLINFLSGVITTQEYEEECKKLLGYDCFHVFTFDKVFADFQKQVFSAITDNHLACNNLLKAFKYEHQRVNHFFDNSYRLHAHKVVGDEICYLIEYSTKTKRVRINEAEAPEVDTEKVAAEEKALQYVHHFLNAANMDVEKNKVFLQRNKRKMPETRLRDVSIRNGLECKICIATFKMFYVEDTEDFLFRKSRQTTSAQKQERANKWKSIHEQKFSQLPQQ
ncbi:hypothetical protein ABK040_012685 [Willaertia magna]